MVKGYKVFNPDWTCRNFQYEVGKLFRLPEDEVLSICECGFHFCQKLEDCFYYYAFQPQNKIAEVIATGDVKAEKDKMCTNEILILREIPWHEALEMLNNGTGNTGYGNCGDCNTGIKNTGGYNTGSTNFGGINTGLSNVGDANTGDSNRGRRNTGSDNIGDWNVGSRNIGDGNVGNHNMGNFNVGMYNVGYYNTGDCNLGDYNTGDYNLGSRFNGCFNTEKSKIYMFNKPTDWSIDDWYNSSAYKTLMKMPRTNIRYIGKSQMTMAEIKDNPEVEVTGGFLRTEIANTKDVNKWWALLETKQKEAIMDLPNFDKDIFKKITGIDVDGMNE